MLKLLSKRVERLDYINEELDKTVKKKKITLIKSFKKNEEQKSTLNLLNEKKIHAIDSKTINMMG